MTNIRPLFVLLIATLFCWSAALKIDDGISGDDLRDQLVSLDLPLQSTAHGKGQSDLAGSVRQMLEFDVMGGNSGTHACRDQEGQATTCDGGWNQGFTRAVAIIAISITGVTISGILLCYFCSCGLFK